MLSRIPLSLWSAQGDPGFQNASPPIPGQAFCPCLLNLADRAAPWVVQLTLRATAPIPSANVYHSLSRRSAIDFVFSVDAVAGQT
jgi:hypothetical protein